MSYIYDLTDTWNAAGTTFTAIKMNVTDTASAAGSLLMDLQVGGSSRFSVRKDGFISASSEFAAPTISTRNNSGALTLGSSVDVILTRDAADTLAQRRGTNAQAFRVYNTYTDASNYERGEVHWVSNVFRVGTYAAGTGTGRTLTFLTSGVERWSINAGNGHFLAAADNTYDIGANGANRPRSLYLGSTLYLNNSNLQNLAQLVWNNGTSLRSPSDGVIGLYDNAGTTFGRLQFGGTTSSFPSLKRNGTAIETKLADDSAYAPHAMQFLDVTDGITAPAAATGRARIYVDTADGDLKIIFADGTIKTIVTDT